MKKLITTLLLTLGLTFGLISVGQANINSSVNGVQTTVQADTASAWGWGWGWCKHKWWCKD